VVLCGDVVMHLTAWSRSYRALSCTGLLYVRRRCWSKSGIQWLLLRTRTIRNFCCTMRWTEQQTQQMLCCFSFTTLAIGDLLLSRSHSCLVLFEILCCLDGRRASCCWSCQYTCLENLEMSGNLTAVRDMSGKNPLRENCLFLTSCLWQHVLGIVVAYFLGLQINRVNATINAIKD